MVKMLVMYGTAEVTTSNGQCSKPRSYPDNCATFNGWCIMCTHVLCMIGQTLLFVNSLLDSKKKPKAYEKRRKVLQR